MQESELRTILFDGRRLVFGGVLLGLLLALLSVRLTDRTYEATALLEVHAAPSADGLPIAPAGTLAETYAGLIVDRSFLEAIRGRVRPLDGRRRSVRQLGDALRADAVPGAQLVRLRAEGPSRDDARDLANDVADAFVITVRQETEQRAAQLHDRLRARLNVVERRLRKRPSADLYAERQALVARDADLTVAAAQQGLSVSEPRPATAAADPVRPKPLLSLLAGLLLGLVVGVGLAWLRSALAPARVDERERVLARAVRQ